MADDARRDWGLVVRIVGASVLVVLANVAFVSLLLWLTSYVVVLLALFGLLPGGTLGAVAAVGNPANWRSPAVLPLTAAFMLGQYAYATRRPVGPACSSWHPAPADLQSRLRRLAKQAGIPTPDLVVAAAPEANSYAVGRWGAATVVVTEPLLAALDDDELDAVLAHELAHVANRDVTVMTVATTPFRLAHRLALAFDWFVYVTGGVLYGLLSVGILLVTVAAFVGLTLQTFLPGSASEAGTPGFVVMDRMGYLIQLVVVPAGTALLLATLFALVPLVATGAYRVLLDPVPRLLARYREFVADRGAARLTGDPAALTSALETLDAGLRPDTDARRRDPVDALCLRPGGLGTDRPRGPLRTFVEREYEWLDAALERLSGGLVAHPPTAARVERLRSLAA